jgi:hypothetical protein
MVTTASKTRKAGRGSHNMEAEERKFQRAEALRISKKKDNLRRRHLGIKRKKEVISEITEKQFLIKFPELPVNVFFSTQSRIYKRPDPSWDSWED